MKRFFLVVIVLCLFSSISSNAQNIEEPRDLYALSAVLMDAETGRILFAKNGEEVRAMASTTKIMTCILTLESGKEDEVVTVSEKAAGQPKVRLGIKKGEQYYLKDLLYSLMLESHNDVAVAVAEHVGGSVEDFAMMMNQKAKEIGCHNTYFITPNGLDATEGEKNHSTTAKDLARIMSYCILESPKKEAFLSITQTGDYKVEEIGGKRRFSCKNHNTFLQMSEEALSGKTGFTNEAGYCYVGAVESEGRVFVVALLGCGWPSHKDYKWRDMRKIVQYGKEYYTKHSIPEQMHISDVPVRNGVNDTVRICCEREEKSSKKSVLLRADEQVDCDIVLEQELLAPVEKGMRVGEIVYHIQGEVICTVPLVVAESVAEKNFRWYVQKVMEKFCTI